MSDKNSSDTMCGDYQLSASISPIARKFVFNRLEGCEAGIISFNDGKMTFKGNADESAEIFLGYLKERYDFEWIELKKKVDALAAEMSVMDAIHDKCVLITDDDYDACPKGVQEIIRSLAVMQIPATDAYLNSVRADAVQELADSWYAIANETSEGVSISDSTRLKYRQRADDAADFAAQLRAGKDGE